MIGAGPAGLWSALKAGRSGARVIIADEDFLPGGRLNAETHSVNDSSGADWAVQCVNELRSIPNVRFMTRTTVYGAYDHGVYGALERKTDHLGASSSNDKPRQVLWRVYTKRALLTSGATERSIAFGKNDRPGIMLAGAVRTYANRFAVTPGKTVAVFTNNNDGWRTAHDLSAKGVNISAVVDTRSIPAPMHLPGVAVVMGGEVATTTGRGGINRITLSTGQTIPADCLAVSGGWNPNVHLTCHQRGRPTWNDEISAFVPGDDLPVGMRVAGAAAGHLSLSGALSSACLLYTSDAADE